MRTVDPAHDGALPPLGNLKQVEAVLARFNTAQDGALGKASMGLLTMYGPGMILEVPTGSDEISQLMVTMTDEDFAFPVLMRLCREQKWTLMDPETGQRLRFGA
jgi:hypothetical protein